VESVREGVSVRIHGGGGGGMKRRARFEGEGWPQLDAAYRFARMGFVV